MEKNSFEISGNIVDIINGKIYPGTVTVKDSKIYSIEENKNEYDNFIMPGFIDAHVHVESSMLIPSEFARMAVVHGTVSTVSDPHEIANVLGMEGVRYMIRNGNKVPFKFYFGAPSCVPATTFETAGAEITSENIRELFTEDGLHYLSEMMNYPGVLFDDPVVMEKIKIAKELGRPVDGHAPGLMGENAKKYISHGISTDHECFTLSEALDKLEKGMKIIIREGSAAKNYEALHTIIKDHSDSVMFCSDDKHPNDLVEGQIDKIVARSVSLGYDIFDVLKCACINPVEHYKLNTGILRKGDDADFIVVKDLKDFKVVKTFINGELVSENGKSLIERVDEEIINHFNTSPKSPTDFEVTSAEGRKSIRVIEALDGQLITSELHLPAKIENGKIISDPGSDILKIAVVERYTNSKPAVAFIRNFGLTKGAIASCVAHDSHNIIAVGVSDEDICKAVNAIIENKGGISVSADGVTESLPLPVAGIMTTDDGWVTAGKYTALDKAAKDLGTKLKAPFMTLSFMALLVIPQLKLSDKGLFDGSKFEFADLIL
ncbi:MAG: adenine deaminase [Ignavibacteria bacterium]|jgi:adenine deaminase|nr:adenine deaminase [Ignavibacteria bacterium]